MSLEERGEQHQSPGDERKPLIDLNEEVYHMLLRKYVGVCKSKKGKFS